MVVYGDGIGEAVLHAAVQNIRRQRVDLISVSSGHVIAALENSLSLHPAVVVALANDVDLLDIGITDVGNEQRAVAWIPRQPVRVAEAVCVDLTERLRITVGSELVDRRNRIVADAARAA